MKKAVIQNALVILMIFFLVSCSKSEEPTMVAYPEVNPLPEFLTASGFSQYQTQSINFQFREFGFVFAPKVKGLLKGIVYKTPEASTPVRITLWDATLASVLFSQQIQPNGAGLETELPIVPIQLEANKRYMLTANNNDWYVRQKSNFGSASYPIETACITFLSCGYKVGSAQSFPDTFDTQVYWGDLSFKFQQN